MKNERTPSEIIDFIGDIIKEREGKSLPTFYTISIEQYDKTTAVAEKESGYDNFKQQVLKYMSDYNLNSLSVQLFSGKSRNVKNPFQTFKVSLKKINPSIMLGGVEKENEVQQMENSISVSRYYDEKFELQMRIMRSEMDKQSLLDKVNQLIEKYEDKLKEQEGRNVEKTQVLVLKIESQNKQISELERDIERTEKDKHNSIGNVALGSVAGHAIEKFAFSKLGMTLLEGVLGKQGFDNLKGHLSGIESEQKETEQKETARIITQPNPTETTTAPDQRKLALGYILKVAKGLDDIHLRMIYDIAELSEKNLKDLEVIYFAANQIKSQRNKPVEQNPVTTETVLPPLNNTVTEIYVSNKKTEAENPENSADENSTDTKDNDEGASIIKL